MSTGARPFAWTHSYLLEILTGSNSPIITNPLLLNAFRVVDRKDFIPEDLTEYAYQDKLIEIGYEEITTNPVTIARQLQILDPRYGGKYLHLGASTGYVSALLAFSAGAEGNVFALERIQYLWEIARQNLKKYPEISSLEILYRNGFEGLPSKTPFDGIIYSYVQNTIHTHILSQLQIGGRLVAPTEDHALTIIDRVGDDEYVEEKIYGFSSYSYGEDKSGVA